MAQLLQKIALIVIGGSVLALAGAFTAQYVFDLAPCKLCIWQRWPFAIAIVLGLLALALSKSKPVLSVAAIGASGLTFLANAGIAVFHTGVERKWWAGLQGCSAPDLSGSVDDLLARIQNSNGARCDEIPWADPILGLSMANYNIVYCLLLAVFCFAVVTSFVKQSRG